MQEETVEQRTPPTFAELVKFTFAHTQDVPAVVLLREIASRLEDKALQGIINDVLTEANTAVKELVEEMQENKPRILTQGGNKK